MLLIAYSCVSYNCYYQFVAALQYIFQYIFAHFTSENKGTGQFLSAWTSEVSLPQPPRSCCRCNSAESWVNGRILLDLDHKVLTYGQKQTKNLFGVFK